MIEVESLRKVYGPVVAVNDVSFEVFEGETLGMVGPNGAGETTTVECVAGLRLAGRRGLANVAIQPYLTAAVINLKHLAAFLAIQTAICYHSRGV